MDDLRKKLEERIKSKTLTQDQIQQKAIQFIENVKALQSELRKFSDGVEGISLPTPVGKNFISVYGKNIEIPFFEVKAHQAVFSLMPTIQIGGNSPSATQFKLQISATRLKPPFDADIYYDEKTQEFRKFNGVTVGAGGQPEIVFGETIDLDDFKRAIIDALT